MHSGARGVRVRGSTLASPTWPLRQRVCGCFACTCSQKKSTASTAAKMAHSASASSVGTPSSTERAMSCIAVNCHAHAALNGLPCAVSRSTVTSVTNHAPAFTTSRMARMPKSRYVARVLLQSEPMYSSLEACRGASTGAKSSGWRRSAAASLGAPLGSGLRTSTRRVSRTRSTPSQ